MQKLGTRMALERLGMRPADLRDPFLRQMQRRFDAQFFDEQPYALEHKGISHAAAKVGHIALHIVRARHKIEAAINGDPSGAARVATEVIGDTAMHRTQLANELRCNLARTLGEVTIAESDMEYVRENIVRAEVPLVAFAERLEHQGEFIRFKRSVVEDAIPALHLASVALANHFEGSSTASHKSRLIDLIRLRTTTLGARRTA